MIGPGSGYYDLGNDGSGSSIVDLFSDYIWNPYWAWVEHKAGQLHRPVEPSSVDPSTIGSKEPVLRAFPWDYFDDSGIDWRKRGYGCGGMAAFRVLGDKGEQPREILIHLSGITAYSEFSDAVAALQRKGGLIMAVQTRNEIMFKDGRIWKGPIEEPLNRIDGNSLILPAVATGGNFATLQGKSSTDWYWEHATRGWSGKDRELRWDLCDEKAPAVIHSRGLSGPPRKRHTLYYVIPGSLTKSPVPAPGSFGDGRVP
jgi:hypothetical protein